VHGRAIGQVEVLGKLALNRDPSDFTISVWSVISLSVEHGPKAFLHQAAQWASQLGRLLSRSDQQFIGQFDRGLHESMMTYLWEPRGG
jgi:hypothetical protein